MTGWEIPVSQHVVSVVDGVVQVLDAEARSPFKLEFGAMRLVLVHLASTETHLLGLYMHHISMDGTTGVLLVQQIASAYNLIVTSCEPTLHKPTVQYADYASWQHAYFASDNRLEEQLAWWQATLREPPLLALQTSSPRPATPSGQGGAVELRLEAAEKLVAVCHLCEATAMHGVLALWAMLLCKCSGQSSVMIGVPFSNRGQPEVERLLGFFVNFVAMRLSLKSSVFRDLVASAAVETLAALEHGETPFSEVVYAVIPPERRHRDRPLLCQATLSWLPSNWNDQSSLMTGLVPVVCAKSPEEVRLSRHLHPWSEAFRGLCKFEIELFASFVEDGSICGAVCYNADIFEHESIQRLVYRLEQSCKTMTSMAESSELLYCRREAELLSRWNATSAPLPTSDTITRALERGTLSQSAVAVNLEFELVTCVELERLTSQIAGTCAQRMAGRQVAALCTIKGKHEVLGMIGVMRAGAAYVPLDPKYPTSRAAFLLRQSNCSFALVQREFRHKVQNHGADIVVIEAILDEQQSFATCRASTSPSLVACFLFTSGSTGTPKGVAVTHAAQVFSACAVGKMLQVWHESLLLHITSYTFVDCTLFLALGIVFSAQLVIPETPDLSMDPQALRQALTRHPVDQATFVPSLFCVMLEHWGTGADLALNTLVLSGEPVTAAAATKVLEHMAKPTKVWNLYGQTEAAAYVTGIDLRALEPSLLAGVSAPIGMPIGNMSCAVLDSNQECSPVRVAGMLAVGGPQLSKGYVGAPDTTNLAFSTDLQSCQRLYHTGDRVCWLPNGVLEYLGRADFQIKLNGQRVEAGEIESVLREVNGVHEAVVVLQGTAVGSEHLVAYLVPEDVDLQAAKHHCQNKTPSYMVPSKLLSLAAWPLNSSGKVDRRQLPQCDTATTAQQLDVERVERVLRSIPGVVDACVHTGQGTILAHAVVEQHPILDTAWQYAQSQVSTYLDCVMPAWYDDVDLSGTHESEIDTDMVVVGAGNLGLVAAGEFKQAGLSVMLLEKSDTPMGCWNKSAAANPSSHVAVVAASYHFFPSADLPEYTRQPDLIKHGQAFIHQQGLASLIHYRCEVTNIEQKDANRPYVEVTYHTAAGQVLSVASKGAFIAIGAQHVPRQLEWAGESEFESACGTQVGYGIRGDIAVTAFQGKRVVIVGNGAFATENVRIALTNKATHVSLVFRRALQVWPRVVNYLTNLGGVSFAQIESIYEGWKEWAGMTAESLGDGAMDLFMSRNTFSQPSISDFVFGAHKAGLLTLHKGEIRRCVVAPPGVEIEHTAQVIPCEIFIKCIGWEMPALRDIMPSFQTRRFAFLNDNPTCAFVCDPHYQSSDPNLINENPEVARSSLLTMTPKGGSFSNLVLARMVARMQLLMISKPKIFDAAMPQWYPSPSPMCSWLEQQWDYDGIPRLTQLVDQVLMHTKHHLLARFPTPASFVQMAEEKFMTEMGSTVAGCSVSYPMSKDGTFVGIAEPPGKRFGETWATTGAKILEACRTQLPRYMLPNSVIMMDAWPLNDGRVDWDLLHQDNSLQVSCADSALAALQSTVVDHIKEFTGLNVQLHSSLMEAGVTSLGAVRLSHSLQGALDASAPRLPRTLIFDYPTPGVIAEYVHSHFEAIKSSTTSRRLSDIADTKASNPVTGISCIAPGSAMTPNHLWCGLLAAQDVIGLIPHSRCDVEPTSTALYVRHGHFIAGAELFDSELFSMATAEVSNTDPMQRLLLQSTLKALTTTGRQPSQLIGSCFGVCVGFTLSGWEPHDKGINTYSAHGRHPAAACGRVSYLLGLTGPCTAVDTACSSSLVALHFGHQSVGTGGCTLMVCTGVMLDIGLSIWAALSALNALAPDGRCKTFDANADGFGRGEGCFSLVLEQVHTKCLAVDLCGSAINQDGKSASFMAPNGPSQQVVINTAWSEADRQFESIESHGTGTALGDPIETGAIYALAHGREQQLPWTIGALKTHFGHGEIAAGAAGAMKALCMLQMQSSTPNVHLSQVNPYLDLESVSIALPSQPSPSKATSTGISSFGYAGTNAHIVLNVQDRSHERMALPTSVIVYKMIAFVWWDTIVSSVVGISSSTIVSRAVESIWERSWPAPSCAFAAHHRTGRVSIVAAAGSICLALSAVSVASDDGTATFCIREPKFLGVLFVDEHVAPMVRTSLQSVEPWAVCIESNVGLWVPVAVLVVAVSKPRLLYPPNTAFCRNLAFVSQHRLRFDPAAFPSELQLAPLSKLTSLQVMQLAGPESGRVSRHIYCTQWMPSRSLDAQSQLGISETRNPLKKPLYSSIVYLASEWLARPAQSYTSTLTEIQQLLMAGTPSELLIFTSKACGQFESTGQLLALLQQACSSSLPRVWICTSECGAWLGSTSGLASASLAKVCNIEMQTPSCRTVQVGLTKSDRILTCSVLTEHTELDPTIRMSGGEMQIRRLCGLGNPAARRLSPESFIHARSLISGGTGGVGLLVAGWFADAGLGQLGLLARKGIVGGDAQQPWQSLLSSAGTIQIQQCNVADRRALCCGTRKSLGGRAGHVVHAAGVLADGMLLSQEQAGLQHVWAPKALAAWHLHVENIQAESFVLFSSTAALMGAAGQANYAAANASLDVLATQRTDWHLTGMSIQWGPWAGIGMAARSRLDQLDSQGVGPILHSQGMRALEQIMTSSLGFSVVAMVPLRWPTLVNWFQRNSELPRLLANLAAPYISFASCDNAESSTNEPLDMVATMEQLLSEILPSQSTLDDQIVDLLDSLSSVELRNRISSAFNISLSMDKLFSLNVADLKDFVLAQSRLPETNLPGASTRPKRDLTQLRVACGTSTQRSLSRPIIFVLSAPRSGSTLLQLCLNAHSSFFAPQELYLLPFDSMEERQRQLGGSTLVAGLLQCVQELQQCSTSKADEIIQGWSAWSTLDVYLQLQQWCHPRVLVDKTPMNTMALDFLFRAQSCFANASYIHIIRHPYTCIKSGIKLANDNSELEQTGIQYSWTDIEDQYNMCNNNIDLFFQHLSQSFVNLKYEDLIKTPKESLQCLCAKLGFSFEPSMATPYDTSSVNTFTGALGVIIGDPRLLKYKSIDASQAEYWRKVQPPQPLRLATRAIASRFGFELRPELPQDGCLELLHWGTQKDICTVFFPDISGTLWAVRRLARQYGERCAVTCLGIETSHQPQETQSYQHLCQLLELSILKACPAQASFQFIAYSYFGRVAATLAGRLQRAGHAVELALIDAPVYGPIVTPSSVIIEALSLFGATSDPASLSNSVLTLTSIAAEMPQPEALEMPVLMFKAADPAPGHMWLPVVGGVEVRPILHRGNEHASVLVYYVQPSSASFRVCKSALPPELDGIGHWFGAVMTMKHVTKDELSIFSAPDSSVEVGPDEVFLLRVHHWTKTAHPKTSISLHMPTLHGRQIVPLLQPEFCLPQIWTRDLPSRILFKMYCDEFVYPQYAHYQLRRMFLPVANKSLCYIYFATTHWSSFALECNGVEPAGLYLTYYDKCGHAFAGSHVAGEALRSAAIPVEHQNGVLLGRIIPRSADDLHSLLTGGSLTLGRTAGQSQEQLSCPLSVFNAADSSKATLKRSRATLLKLALLAGLRCHYQEVAKDDDWRMEIARMCCANLEVCELAGVHHFDIPSKAGLLTRLLADFFSCTSQPAAPPHRMWRHLATLVNALQTRRETELSQAWRCWQHVAVEVRLQHNLLDLVVFGGVGCMLWEHAAACFRLWRGLTASTLCKQRNRWQQLCKGVRLSLITAELTYSGYSYSHMRTMEEAAQKEQSLREL